MSFSNRGRRGRTPPDISHLHSIMVFNISYRTRKEELYRTFDRFGDIADVYIPRDRHGESRGFGFVRFYDKRDAEDAKGMDGRMVDGRRIGVQMAKYGRRHEQSGYRGGGGGGYNNYRRSSYSRSRSRSPRRGYNSRSRSRSRSGHYRRRYYSRSRSRSLSNDRYNDNDRDNKYYRRRSFSRSKSRSPSNSRRDRNNNNGNKPVNTTTVAPQTQLQSAQQGIPSQQQPVVTTTTSTVPVVDNNVVNTTVVQPVSVQGTTDLSKPQDVMQGNVDNKGVDASMNSNSSVAQSASEAVVTTTSTM